MLKVDALKVALEAIGEIKLGIQQLNRPGCSGAWTRAYRGKETLMEIDTAAFSSGDQDAFDSLRSAVGEAMAGSCRHWQKKTSYIAFAVDDFQSHFDGTRTKRMIVKMLPKVVLNSYRQYQCAEMQLGEKATDKQAWNWLRKEDGDVPAFLTWARYLRQARKALGENKNTPRAGRAGRSIVDDY